MASQCYKTPPAFTSILHPGSPASSFAYPHPVKAISPPTMKLTYAFAVIATLVTPAFSTSVTYDPVYDNAAGSMNTVACSNGPNGIITKKGYTTFGALPNFPNIGGASAVTGWNSDQCGTCWALTFTDGQGKKTTVNILAIDYAQSGFNIGLTAMNNLTNGNAVQYGVVTVSSEQVDASVCGM